MSTSYITRPDDISERLCISLVNYNDNEDFLSTKPFMKKGSMAVIALLNISDNMFLPVSNEMLDKWNIPTNMLFKMALDNSNKILPVKVEPLYKYINQSKESMVFNFSLEDTCDLSTVLMLTNTSYSLGAASIFAEPTKLDEISDMYDGADVFLFPICSDFTFCMSSEGVTPDEAKEIFEHLSDLYDIEENERISDSILIYNASESSITEYGDTPCKYDLQLNTEDVANISKHSFR